MIGLCFIVRDAISVIDSTYSPYINLFSFQIIIWQCKCLLNNYQIPGPIPSNLLKFHLIFTITLWSRTCHHPWFIDITTNHTEWIVISLPKVTCKCERHPVWYQSPLSWSLYHTASSQSSLIPLSLQTMLITSQTCNNIYVRLSKVTTHLALPTLLLSC